MNPHNKKIVAIALTAITALNSFGLTMSLSTHAITTQTSLTVLTDTKSAFPDSQSVYDVLISFKKQYPDGTPWGKNKSYNWKGGIYTTGNGCAAFAFMLSDAAFGNLPARTTKIFNPSDVRIGDIINYHNHSVVVLEIKNDGFIVAEGSLNEAVKWGRLVTNVEISADFIQHITRYPQIITGDSNGDGKIDAADASCVLEDYALIQTGNSDYLPENRKKADDVTNDGKVDSIDASKILDYYAALSTGKNPNWN